MFLAELRTLPNDLVSLLSPVRVQEYVRAAGWIHQPALNGKSAVYERPESRREQIIIPLSRDLADFTPRMAEAVAHVAVWEKRPARQLLDELLLPPADLIHFSHTGPATEVGGVPVAGGLRLLGRGPQTAVGRCLRGVATGGTVLPPHKNRGGRVILAAVPTGADGKRSFTVSVACPLDTASPLEETPYSRRVTELLMQSLRRLAHAAETADPDAALSPTEGEPVVSANLCEALLDMMPEGRASELTITGSWERARFVADGLSPMTVRLRREDFALIESLARRLRPVSDPQRQTFLGVVETLNGRPGADGRVEGEVALTVLDPEGEPLRALVDLSADNYAAAAEAHLRVVPVSLEGVLRRDTRTSRIEDVTKFELYPRLTHKRESA